MIFRYALLEDLPVIVSIYNSTIAGRRVTADTEPVSVADRLEWFHEHTPHRRPLWMVENDNGETLGWISLQDFYGRPAYDGTAEISIYLHENHRGKGYGKTLMEFAIEQCHSLQIHTLLGFIFEQNTESLKLFSRCGFNEWAHLPHIAVLDNTPCSLKILGLKVNQ